MQKTVKERAEACQETKLGRHTVSVLKQIVTHVHMVVVGSLPESGGYKGWQTINDRTTSCGGFSTKIFHHGIS